MELLTKLQQCCSAPHLLGALNYASLDQEEKQVPKKKFSGNYNRSKEKMWHQITAEYRSDCVLTMMILLQKKLNIINHCQKIRLV